MKRKRGWCRVPGWIAHAGTLRETQLPHAPTVQDVGYVPTEERPEGGALSVLVLPTGELGSTVPPSAHSSKAARSLSRATALSFGLGGTFSSWY